MRVWTYVITADRGSAPNYDGGLVTLTICKPRIRKAARRGDLVIAFNGTPLQKKPHRDPNTIRWAGIVDDVVPLEDYWEDARFRSKRPDHSTTPDNIYRLIDDTWVQIPNSSHGERNISTDLRGRNALVFRRAWHCGDDAPHLPFDNLWITANRRNEPLRDMPSEDWEELLQWLDAHARPFHSLSGTGRGCRPHKEAKRKSCC